MVTLTISAISHAVTGLLLASVIGSAAKPALAAEDLCALPPQGVKAWLPTTPKPNEKTAPAPHDASDCGFYRPAWQRFLYVTQPSPVQPAFMSYPGIDELFAPVKATSHSRYAAATPMLTPRNMEQPNSFAEGNSQPPSDINQAGLQGVLIDQKGHPIYYRIQANPEFRAYLVRQKLTSLAGIEAMKPEWTFPPGVIELKSAWMVVDGPNAAPNYFVTNFQVPHYTVDTATGKLKQAVDAKGVARTDPAWVALIALHIAFTLPGHSEMVWSTFEHVHLDSGRNVTRDNAPAAAANPSKTPPETVISTTDFPLYKAGTKAGEANVPADPKVMADHFDEITQSFTKGGLLQTSVYRPYPGSKTDGPAVKPGEPDPSSEDTDVIAINNNATALFEAARNVGQPRRPDLRENYRLVGAVWIDRPEINFLKPNKGYTVDLDHTTDEHGAVLAGEGRLGATAIESFTQNEDSSPSSASCFSCHDTHRVSRDITSNTLLNPAMLNVSHILSKFKEMNTVQPARP